MKKVIVIALVVFSAIVGIAEVFTRIGGAPLSERVIHFNDFCLRAANNGMFWEIEYKPKRSLMYHALEATFFNQHASCDRLEKPRRDFPLILDNQQGAISRFPRFQNMDSIRSWDLYNDTQYSAEVTLYDRMHSACRAIDTVPWKEPFSAWVKSLKIWNAWGDTVVCCGAE